MKHKIIVAILVFGSVLLDASQVDFRPISSLIIVAEGDSVRSCSTTPKNATQALLMSIDESQYDDAVDLLRSVSRSGKFTPIVCTEIQEAVVEAVSRKDSYKFIPLEHSTGSASIDSRLEFRQNLDPALAVFISEVNSTVKRNSPVAKSYQEKIDDPSTSEDDKALLRVKLTRIMQK